HLMPGVATAEALRKLLPHSRSLFLVTERGADRLCRRALAPFQTAEVAATRWDGAGRRAQFTMRSVLAAGRVLHILRRFRPHVVVGLGGHNCVVPTAMGRLLGICTMLFESNAIAGRAVRLLAPLADCVALQWARAAAGLKTRQVLVAGNPVRARLFGVQREAARRRLGLAPRRQTVLVMGGSQGALALNQVLFAALESIRARGIELQVVHLTGVDHLPAALEWHEAHGLPSYRPIGFTDRMEDAYGAADFVVARAGGSTLAELTALGLPAILIPYPHHADGHQRANAAVLAEAGAALTIRQSELDGRRLASAIATLAVDERLRQRMAECALRIGRPEAALVVASELAAMAGFASQLERLARDQDAVPDGFSQAA
ncbi:MAG: UDP-N-acetylglucosamine--N-acetylmuramyl-(pentapeptide) pyrophosphoryl-undecaprenol N-acetylglucosamine transferase, partial [Planctomycetota bacterium]